MENKTTNETKIEHAQRHIQQLEKLLQERPEDPMIPTWKLYLAQYRILLDFYSNEINFSFFDKYNKKENTAQKLKWLIIGFIIGQISLLMTVLIHYLSTT